MSETELTVKETAPLATATHNPFGLMKNADETDFVIPSAHLYQDTGREREVFQGCGFEPGDLIDTLEQRVIESRRFMIVDRYKDWVDGRKNAPVKVSRDPSAWPKQDLEFNGDNKPAVTKRLNFVVLFEGEDWPLVVHCKKTSMRAGKALNTMFEKHAGRVVYRYDTKQESNDQGAYYVPSFKPDGQAPQEFLAKALAMREKLVGAKIDEGVDVTDGTDAADDGDAPF